jgi:hypothetical protein
VPQVKPWVAQLFVVHTPVPHTLLVPPPPQLSPLGHEPPQVSKPPQPSVVVPQLVPAGHAFFGVQVLVHLPAAPQVSLPVQVPQLRMLPQPSVWLPHTKPCFAQSPLYAAHGPPVLLPLLPELLVAKVPMEPPLPMSPPVAPDDDPSAPVPTLVPLVLVLLPPLHEATATTTAAADIKAHDRRLRAEAFTARAREGSRMPRC